MSIHNTVHNTDVNQDDVSLCLLTDDEMNAIVDADFQGFLFKKLKVPGWCRYWVSVKGSRLLYFEKKSFRRGWLAGTVILFKCKVYAAMIASRKLEFDVVDFEGKTHIFKAQSPKELHLWITVLTDASKIIPPPKSFFLSMSQNMKSGFTPTFRVSDHVDMNAVVFVLHGAGSEHERFQQNVQALRESHLEIMNLVYPDITYNVDFRACHWRSTLSSLEEHENLRNTIPKVDGEAQPIREFMADKIMDLMYFTQKKYKMMLIQQIAELLNQEYADFIQKHKLFRGSITIIAHSLGSVLAFELICRQYMDDVAILVQNNFKLNFKVENLFIIGSPLGQILCLNEKLRSFYKGQEHPFFLYNICHPHDPLCFRIEPALDRDYKDVPPVVLPNWITMDRAQTAITWIKNLLQRKKPERGSGNDIVELGAMGSQIRIDYILQATTAVENLSISISSLRAHNQYWFSRDIMLFMISTLLKKELAQSQREIPMVEMDMLSDKSSIHGQHYKSGGRTLFEDIEDCFVVQAIDESPDDNLIVQDVEEIVDTCVEDAVEIYCSAFCGEI